MAVLDRLQCDIDTKGFYRAGERNPDKRYRTVSGVIARQMANVMTLMCGGNNAGEDFRKDAKGGKSVKLLKLALGAWLEMRRPLVVRDSSESFQ